VLAAVYRPWRVADWGSLDRWIVASVAATAWQLVPLPAAVVDRLSPHARSVWAALSLAVPSALPLSIDLRAGAWAAALGAAAVTVFLAARRLFETGGVRVVVRGIAAIGLVLSAVAIAQDATGGGRMYWRWRPLQEGAPPFGPFVDRNHFATWVLLALPLAAGYLAAHLAAHHHDAPVHSWRTRLAGLFDGRALWLTGSAALMLLALGATLSRSGLFGLACAGAVGLAARSHHHGRPMRTAGWIGAGVTLVLLLGLARVDPAALVHRISIARTSAADRVLIWRDTLPVVRDFWLTGSGAGTYETAMLIYQRADAGGARFNQAHNQYLQLLAEGGCLLTVPVVAALWLYLRRARISLAGDHSGMYWIRAGALAGLAAVAGQGLFDTGLTTPANTLLAAVCAALVIHVPGPHARAVH
jgi:hypothetical protein